MKKNKKSDIWRKKKKKDYIQIKEKEDEVLKITYRVLI